MLDYAANAVAYWSIEKVIAEFEATCAQIGRDPAESLVEHLGDAADPDSFWEDVKTNLEAGRVRLVFVADRIPTELQRIVEFLNGQMNPAEAFAVEIRQFAGARSKTLVPRVLGQSALAQQKRSRGRKKPGQKWDEPRLMEALRASGLVLEAEVVATLSALARENGLRVVGGTGQVNGSLCLEYESAGIKYQLCYLWTHNHVGVPFNYLVDRPPFDSDVRRLELRDRLNELDNVDIPKSDIAGSPSFPISVLTEAGNRERFWEHVLQWMVSEVDRHHNPPIT